MTDFDELKNSNEFLIAHKISFSFLVHITVFTNQVQRYVYINFIYAIIFFFDEHSSCEILR